jgi:hypothetical protein
VVILVAMGLWLLDNFRTADADTAARTPQLSLTRCVIRGLWIVAA